MREVLAAIARHAAATPHRSAIRDRGGASTYAMLWDAVTRLIPWAAALPRTIALLPPKDRDGVALQLALLGAGRTIVPVPDFFSPAQKSHLIRDSRAEAVVATARLLGQASQLGIPVRSPEPAEWNAIAWAGDGRLITYTSGTTGTPKGVVHGAVQLDASVRALVEAVGADPDDRMLSALPPALLLDLVACIAVPLYVGASIDLCDDPRALPSLAAASAPTATVLVPEMLNAWVAWLEHTGTRAPFSLRFVAVGGAPLAPRLARRALELGLPVHEGYGLTECCSVVAVNRPGRRVAGTVGPPLPGLDVSVIDGEVVVSGPTVMERYLGGDPSGGIWRTGDAGRFDAAGNLIVDGRIDDVIVTTTGRNIHPAWIEAMILADPRIERCAVVAGGRHTRAVLCPRDPALTDVAAAEVDALVTTLCAEAPDYARPRRSVVIAGPRLKALDLVEADGRLRRTAIRNMLEDSR